MVWFMDFLVFFVVELFLILKNKRKEKQNTGIIVV